MSEEVANQEPVKTTRYIFYSVLSKKEDETFRRELFREDIEFTDLSLVSERVARSIYSIFEKHIVEWLVVSPTSNLPDVKNLYLNNEIFNLNQKLNKILSSSKGEVS